MLRVALPRYDLKRDREEARVLRLFLGGSTPAVAKLRVRPMDICGPVARVGSSRARVGIVMQLAAAYTFCQSLFVAVTIHADHVAVSKSGGVKLFVGGVANDARYLAPDGAPCAAWAIGAILVNLITGKPMIQNECAHPLRSVVKCVGTPNWRECAALGIRVPRVVVARAAFPCASRLERRILEMTLAWVASDRLVLTPRGLCKSLPAIPE